MLKLKVLLAKNGMLFNWILLIVLKAGAMLEKCSIVHPCVGYFTHSSSSVRSIIIASLPDKMCPSALRVTIPVTPLEQRSKESMLLLYSLSYFNCMLNYCCKSMGTLFCITTFQSSIQIFLNKNGHFSSCRHTIKVIDFWIEIHDEIIKSFCDNNQILKGN